MLKQRNNRAHTGRLSFFKGEGEGEDSSRQKWRVKLRTPRPLPLRWGEARKLAAVTPLALVAILVSLGGITALAAPLTADMIVSVPDQMLALVDRGKLIARYSISTSKFGTGDSAASYRTPLGTPFVPQKSVTDCLRARSSRIGSRPVKSLPSTRRVATRSFHA